MALGWGPRERKQVRRDAAAWSRQVLSGKLQSSDPPTADQIPAPSDKETNVLTNFPRYFAERNAVPPIAAPAEPASDLIPDVIVAENPIETRVYLDALGFDIVGWLPNRRSAFFKAQVVKGEVVGAVLTGPVEGMTIDDVRDKVVCGQLPLWLAVHAALVIVLEPLVKPSEAETYTLAEGDPETHPLRLAAYRTHRAAADSQAVEGMKL